MKSKHPSGYLTCFNPPFLTDMRRLADVCPSCSWTNLVLRYVFTVVTLFWLLKTPIYMCSPNNWIPPLPPTLLGQLVLLTECTCQLASCGNFTTGLACVTHFLHFHQTWHWHKSITYSSMDVEQSPRYCTVYVHCVYRTSFVIHSFLAHVHM